MYHWNSMRIPVFAWKVWELAVRRRAGGVHLWTRLAVRAIAPAARFVSSLPLVAHVGQCGRPDSHIPPWKTPNILKWR
jgi:hypothetical protein